MIETGVDRKPTTTTAGTPYFPFAAASRILIARLFRRFSLMGSFKETSRPSWTVSMII